MGLFDTVIFADRDLGCPEGHAVREFQTKSFPDPSMSTYLVEGERVLRVERGHGLDEGERSTWRVSGFEAVEVRRHVVEPVPLPVEVDIYTHCEECEPVLVRADTARSWWDIVDEHRVPVDFRLTFAMGEPLRVERISGDRDALREELRHEGWRVLRDDDPLAQAHREIQQM